MSRARGAVARGAVACVTAALLAAAALPRAARAQVPDSLAGAPPTRAGQDLVRADTLVELVAPVVPAPSRAATRVLAARPALSAAAALGGPLGDAGDAFDLRGSARGRSFGLFLGGLAPARPGLALDGRPLDDLATGAPRLDLLPWEATDRLGTAPGLGGRAAGVATTLRPFRAAQPVTELRYLSGAGALQVVSATHAQTRRAPLGGPSARMTLTGHVASRQADDDVVGARLRHVHVVARASVAAPAWGAELVDLYGETREGARRGLTGATFDPLRATPLDAAAERRTIRNELALVGRHRSGLAAWGSWTRQTTRYANNAATDTLTVAGDRYAAGATLGAAGVRLDATALVDADTWGRGDPLGDGGTRAQAHVLASDSLALGAGLGVATRVGASLVGGALAPVGSVDLLAGPARVGLRYGGAVEGRIERAGFRPAGVRVGPGVAIAARGSDGRERTARLEAEAALGRGPLGLRLGAAGTLTQRARRLVALDALGAEADTAFAFVSASGDIREATAWAALGWRGAAERGLYARTRVALRATQTPETALGDQIGEARPAVWGGARLGLRAVGVGTGRAAVDVWVEGEGWSAFRGVRLHPATGLPALAAAADGRLPARGVLAVGAEIAFGTRARVFATWDHLLSGLAGAALAQGEPLPGRALRFGAFWALSG